MNKTGQTVCLCMIVKNEAHVLRRCLDSVRALIDSWLIVDTGSTDGTQSLVCDRLSHLPGELIERPWKNFGWNRSEAVALAQPKADYLLTVDADEYFGTADGFVWPEFTCDAYEFIVNSGGVRYTRLQLFRSTLPWRYEGVVHEYLTCDRPNTSKRIRGIWTERLREGARSREPLTFQRDALLLEEALFQEPENARTVFYLAQSYRDSGDLIRAIQRYRQRAEMAGFPEEVWWSLYEIARLLERLDASWPEVEQAYLAAYRYRPWRAEPLYRIGLHYQKYQQYAKAEPFLRQAIKIRIPTEERLFVEEDVYRFLLPMELGVVCYWLGSHHEAIAIAEKLLVGKDHSPERELQLRHNRQASIDALFGR